MANLLMPGRWACINPTEKMAPGASWRGFQMQTLTEEEKHVLIEAACEAEESFPLDELETYAEEYRRKLETGEL